MRFFEKIWKTAGIFFAIVIVGTILLTAAYYIPVNENNMTASYEIMDKEGWYPAIPIVSASYETYFTSYKPGVLDDSSDYVMLGKALYTVVDSALVTAMNMDGYSRYWHGYVSVLRPLFAVFDYGEIRTGNAMGQLLLMALLFSFIYQKKGIKYALLALTSYCLLMPLAMPFSLQYSWVFYITYGFLLYLVSRKKECLPDGMKLYWIFMAVGMLTSYFDLLTYPLYTWGIPMTWWLLLQEKEQKSSVYVKNTIYTGVWWLFGYAGMWLSKWCLGSIILKENIFEVVFSKGAKWTDSENALELSGRLEAIYANWKHYEYKLYVILLLAWLLFVIIFSIRNGVARNARNKALLLVGMSSAVWYFVMSKHTLGHHFFAYRTWGISILAVLGILIISTENFLEQEKKSKIKIIAVWGGCAVLGAVLSLLPKENVYVINGYCEFKEIRMKEGDVCEMNFTPSFPLINQFMLCAKADSLNGVCKVVVADGETELYEESIPLKEYQNVAYATIPVSWKLKKEKVYSMRISFEGADSDSYILISLNQNMPLSEYSEAMIKGLPQNGQILSALNYRYRALSKFTLLSLWIGWTGTWFAILAAFCFYVKVPDIKEEL